MQGRTYHMAPTDRMTFMISSSTIDFAENEVGYLAGPPLHRHYQAEIHYLIAGKLRYQIGEETIDLTSGEYLYIPENIPHAWVNLHTEPARIIAILTPGGAEGFFQAAAAQSLTPEALMQLAQEYGTEILGAPLAASIVQQLV